MREFLLNEKKYYVPQNWEELTLKRYVNIAKLEEKKSEVILQELYLLKVIEALIDVEDGELDDLTLDMVNEITLDMVFLNDDYDFTKHKKVLKIGDVDYVFPSDLNKLTMGEYISMKTFQENIKSDAEAIPYILSIILRPGKLIKNEETGLEIWHQNRFDVENLEYRKELFLTQPCIDVMGPVVFFLGGKQ